MTNPTVNVLEDWSPFGGTLCTPRSCDCKTTTSDEALSLLNLTAPWLDLPLDEECYPYVPRAFQAD